MRVAAGTAAFICAISLSAASFAATVNPLKGEVLITRGEGYQAITKPIEVSSGAVFVRPEGSAEIVYADGCRLNAEPGVVITIGVDSPCQTQGRNIETGAVVKNAPAPGNWNSQILYFSAGALAGTTLGYVVFHKNHKSNPASP